MTDPTTRQFNFLATLTALVVLGYVGTSVYAFVTAGLDWKDFSGTVGPLAGLLLGYWVRGQQ